MQPNSHTGRYQIPVFREVGCHFTRLCSLLEQVLWAAGSRRRPTWEREIRREKRAAASRDAGSERADASTQSSYSLRCCQARCSLAAAACTACCCCRCSINCCPQRLSFRRRASEIISHAISQAKSLRDKFRAHYVQ